MLIMKLPFEKIERKLIIRKKAVTSAKFGKFPQHRSVEEHINLGIVNIDKPAGPTSHQVSAYVKKILNIKKSGHSGTLDPSVTGVLPVGLQKSTKIIQTLLKAGKEYVCVMHLHKPIPEYKLYQVFEKFTGRIKQLPPIKSSVKRQLRERTIYYIKILEVQDQDVLFQVGCQAGTYIRKLCVHPNTEILTNKGIMSASDFCFNPQTIYCIDKDIMIKKKPSATQKIPSPNKLVKITMSSGIEIIVTLDHKLLNSTDKGYMMKQACNLKKNDYLVKSIKYPLQSKDLIIADLLDDDYLIQQKEIKQQCKTAFIEKYGSIRSMNKTLKLDRKTFLSGSKHAITIKHVKLSGIYDKVKSEINTFKTQKGTIIQLNDLTEDHFYLLGLIASDGNNTKEKNTQRYTRLKFHNTEKELINEFLRIYKKCFPSIKISKKKINNYIYQLDSSNSLFATIAASLGIKSPKKDADILPILYCKKKLIKAFLKGVFDGDGTVYFKKKIDPVGHYTNIRLYSTNKIMIKRLHQMLLKLGIFNRIVSTKESWADIMYFIELVSLASKKKFIKEIGTNHPRKRKYFKQILKLKSDSINNNLYIGLHFKKYIKKNKKYLHKMGGNLNRVLNSEIPITRGFYKKASKLTKLPRLDDFVIEKISDIELIEGTDYVYDMTVPKTHNFLIETGYVSSNCHDIGQELKIGAHMAELRRTKAGPFNEETLFTLQDLTDAFYYYKKYGKEKFIRQVIQPVENAVIHLPKIWVMDTTVNSLCHGASLKVPGISKLESGIKKGDLVAIYTLKNELISYGEAVLNSEDMLKDKGVAVKSGKVVMEPGLYPRIEQK